MHKETLKAFAQRFRKEFCVEELSPQIQIALTKLMLKEAEELCFASSRPKKRDAEAEPRVGGLPVKRSLALDVQEGLQTGILYIGEDAFEMSFRNLAKA